MHQFSNAIGQHDDIGVRFPHLSPLGSDISLYSMCICKYIYIDIQYSIYTYINIYVKSRVLGFLLYVDLMVVSFCAAGINPVQSINSPILTLCPLYSWSSNTAIFWAQGRLQHGKPKVKASTLPERSIKTSFAMKHDANSPGRPPGSIGPPGARFVNNQGVKEKCVAPRSNQ